MSPVKINGTYFRSRVPVTFDTQRNILMKNALVISAMTLGFFYIYIPSNQISIVEVVHFHASIKNIFHDPKQNLRHRPKQHLIQVSQMCHKGLHWLKIQLSGCGGVQRLTKAGSTPKPPGWGKFAQTKAGQGRGWQEVRTEVGRRQVGRMEWEADLAWKRVGSVIAVVTES